MKFKEWFNTETIAKTVNSLNDKIGYGEGWYNPDTKTVWVSVGDWEENPDRYKIALKKIPGVKNVRVEAEYGPKTNGKQKGETWIPLK